MPTYDYHCDACAHNWEEFQSIKADATQICPQCQQPSARRLIGTGAGFLFKGSGFYITDYRSDSYKKSAEADRKSTSDSSGNSSSGGSSSSSGNSKSSGSSNSTPSSNSGSGSKSE